MSPITRALLKWSQSVDVSALDRKLLRDIWRLKTQVVAIAGVVGAGIALLIATFGCVASLQGSMDAFYAEHRFADVFTTLKRAPNSLEQRLAAIPGIADLETRVVVNVTLDMPGIAEPAAGRIISMPEDKQPRINGISLLSGRLVNRSRPSEIIVSEAFADAHKLSLGDQITATINGQRRHLEIVGIALSPEYTYALAPGQFMPDNRRFGILWMGRDALAASYDLEEAFNDVVVTLQPRARETEVIARLDNELRRYGTLGAYGRKDQISHFFLSNELAQLRATGLIAPPIFLAVAAFLLNIVIGRIVTTEREQIGLLKAFGYSNTQVAAHYLKLVAAFVGFGLLLGFLGGFQLGRYMIGLYTDYFRFPLLAYAPDAGTFLAAAAISALAGAAGGAGAVRRAALLSPAVAMAPPTPAAYRRTWLLHLLDGIRLSQPTRMIFRHVTRWPMRTLLTSVGMAFGVATMVASLFFMDTARYVINVVFFEAERQTLTVTFVEPRGAVVAEQIERLPGVLATQPLRQVSVRLQNGPRTKRTFISGIVVHGDLNRLLDRNVRPVDPPPGGLALSRHIAEELDLKLGDLVTLEVMQERRPILSVPVTRIVEQYMGFAAFMHIEALNRIMLEGPTVTGVHVFTDRNNVNSLYRRLKDTPLVAGVALTTAAREGFQTTMENTMYVMIGIYAAFATLIAFGVTYNSARIAFGERARALASIRVLGFTRAEAAYILLGELAVQTVMALPLGCLLGYALALIMSPILKTDMYDFPLIISGATYGLSVLVVIASAVVCAALIARRVYRLDLVSVLKTRE
jgi:putative ABC transport system permease protein